MEKKSLSKLKLFDASFFKFTLFLVYKKTSIYLLVALYILLILSFTVFVPLVSNNSAMDLFSLPISAMFLMFCMAMIASFTAIEIFRTSIDDGTELLTVSKPISRIEIVFVKICVYMLYIVSIGLISTLFSLFIFTTNIGEPAENGLIVGGVFLGTVIIGVIFGSLAILLSIYLKKTIALLTTISISFLLMIYSVFLSFIVQSPVVTIKENGKTLIPMSLIGKSSDKKNNSVINGISTKPPVGSGSNPGDDQLPSEIWNEFSKGAGRIFSTISDIGNQLSSLYTLNSVSSNVNTFMQMAGMFNSPANLKFDKKFEFNGNKDLVSFNITFNGSQPFSELIDTKADFKLFASKGSSSKFSEKEGKNFNTRHNITDFQFSTYVSEEKAGDLWKETWNKVESKIQSASGSDLPEKFLEEFATEEKLDGTNKNIVLEKLNEVAMSGLNWLNEKKTIQLSELFNFAKDFDKNLTLGQIIPGLNQKQASIKWGDFYNSLSSEQKMQLQNDAKNKNELRSLLGILGLKISDNPTGGRPFAGSSGTATPSKPAFLFYPMFSPKFDYNSHQIEFKPLITLADETRLHNFQKVDVVSNNNTAALIISWLTISIVIFCVSMYFYSRRDFA